MDRTHARLKGILKVEERLLQDLLKALPLVSSSDTRFLLREIIRAKRGHIKTYKAAIKAGERKPATPRKRGR